jgi:hypothetical protein
VNVGDLRELSRASEFDLELLALLSESPLCPPGWPLSVWPCPSLQSLSVDELRLLSRFWREQRQHEAELRQRAGFVELDESLRDISMEVTSARRFLRLFVAPPKRKRINTRA